MAGFSGDGDKPRAHLRWARSPAQVQGVPPAGHDRHRQALGVCRVIFLAKVAEIPDGARKLIQVNGISVALFRQEGRFYALNNACPHRQGPLIRGTLEKTAEGSGCPPDQRPLAVGGLTWPRATAAGARATPLSIRSSGRMTNCTSSSELNVQFVILPDERIDSGVARAPAAVARGQVKPPTARGR